MSEVHYDPQHEAVVASRLLRGGIVDRYGVISQTQSVRLGLKIAANKAFQLEDCIVSKQWEYFSFIKMSDEGQSSTRI